MWNSKRNKTAIDDNFDLILQIMSHPIDLEEYNNNYTLCSYYLSLDKQSFLIWINSCLIFKISSSTLLLSICGLILECLV